MRCSNLTVNKFYTALLLTASALSTVSPNTALAESDALAAAHKRGVETAREGKTQDGLKILSDLLAKNPDYYPARRDYMIILTWANDCDAAFEQYQLIKDRPDLEPYVYPPIAECYRKFRDIDQAQALLNTAQEKHPDNEDIKGAQKALQAHIDYESRPALDFSANYSESEKDSYEWSVDLRYTHEITNNTRGYVRSLTVRPHDPEFDTANIDRLGLGVLHWFNHQWFSELEVSQETDGSNNGGHVLVEHYPNSLWSLTAKYASYAEDVPLRGKAQGLEAESAQISAFHHTPDYRWEWYGSYSQYDFSDDNDRRAYNVSAGYAFEMKSYREQRVILDLFASDNSLQDGDILVPGATPLDDITASIPYYNPVKDSTVTLIHRTYFVYEKTKFERHMDTLSLSVGSYKQTMQLALGNRQFERKTTTNVVGAIRFQQEYTLGGGTYFSWGGEWASRVYDDERETNIAVFLNTGTRF